ncbi:CHRD domain-containing protein [Oceanobacillus piezotolerans]|uniref:CHRD domain-containing protein n=1 Tax=Oceanobacillus piezotolerans TaxID=2448030 RepID=A0A498D719_9BACI|nr:CHRD domain-containing protein [Oceanobacillus piezotolerans]RLL45459.1 CHRD domain-containing protein [Oceanobacillus piezotolerans]
MHEAFYMAELVGSQEVPPVHTNAEGVALFYIEKNSDKMRYRIDLEGIRNITQATIQVGRRNIIGPTVVELINNQELTEDGKEGFITNADLAGPLKGKTISELTDLMLTGKAYVNIHTKNHPNGEIRGKINY